MRPNSIKTILMAASVALASTAVAQTTTLTLDDAVRIALSDNPTVKVADSEITKQEYAKKGTLANLMPTLDFSAGYNRTLKKQVMYMGDMKGFGGGSSEGTEGAEGTEAASAMRDGIKVGMDNTWSAGFALSLPLVNAQLWKQLSISADDVELAVEKSRQSRISMVSQVKQAYYAVMLAEASRDALKENYDNAKKKYDDINQKYQQGLSSEYDLIRADVAVKNVEPSLFDAENSIVLAKWRLKALIGVDLDMSIDCTGSLNDYTDRLYDGYMKVDTTMLAQNSSLRQIDLQQRQLLKSRDVAKSAYYPTINLSFAYQWNAMANDFRFKDYRWNPYSTLGLSLNIPIFSGGRRYNSLKQTKVQIDQLALTRLDTERNLMVGVRQSVDKMRTGIRQYESACKSVDQARKGYDIAVKRYDTGAGTLLEVNDSQLALTQSQLNRSQAVYSDSRHGIHLRKIKQNPNEYQDTQQDCHDNGCRHRRYGMLRRRQSQRGKESRRRHNECGGGKNRLPRGGPGQFVHRHRGSQRDKQHRPAVAYAHTQGVCGGGTARVGRTETCRYGSGKPRPSAPADGKQPS